MGRCRLWSHLQRSAITKVHLTVTPDCIALLVGTALQLTAFANALADVNNNILNRHEQNDGALDEMLCCEELTGTSYILQMFCTENFCSTIFTQQTH